MSLHFREAAIWLGGNVARFPPPERGLSPTNVRLASLPAGLTRWARFYFDLTDGEHLTRDADGLIFADLATACREAVRALPSVAYRPASAMKQGRSCSAPCSFST